jgi:hypothetical protein
MTPDEIDRKVNAAMQRMRDNYARDLKQARDDYDRGAAALAGSPAPVPVWYPQHLGAQLAGHPCICLAC